MKALMLLIALTASLNGMAQTIEARMTKGEMIQRTKDLEAHARSARKLIKNEKLTEGCAEIDYLFQHTPAHLTAVLSRMNMGSKKVRKMQDQSLQLLRLVHSMSNTCKRGKDHDRVHPEFFQDALKLYIKRIENHGDIIDDKSVEFDNRYYYEYDL